MGDIVRRWLQFELGVLVDPETTVFARQCRTGYLFAKMLHNYSIINTEQMSWISLNKEECNINRNFTFLQLWLKYIGISCSDERVTKLKQGTTGSAIQLFFEMYLFLGDKYSLEYSTMQLKREQKLFSTVSRFEIEKVKEFDIPKHVDHMNVTNFLLNNSHIMNWKKIRRESMLQLCKQRRNLYRQQLKKFYERLEPDQEKKSIQTEELCKQSFSNEAEIMLLDRPSLISMTKLTVQQEQYGNIDSTQSFNSENLEERDANCNYEDLERDVRRIENMLPFLPRHKDAKEILINFKEDIAAKERMKATKEKLHKNLVSEMSAMFANAAKAVLEDAVVGKLMKTSLYECAMVGKLMDARRYLDVILQNQKILQNNVSDVWKDIFVQNVFESDDARWMCRRIFYLEQGKYTHLFKKIYQQKKRVTSHRNYKFCRTVADGLVDIALRHAEFFEEHEVRPLTESTAVWNTFLVKGQCIFDHLDNIRDVIYYDDAFETDPDIKQRYRKEMLRQNWVGVCCLENYIDDSWNFNIPSMIDVESLLDDNGPDMHLIGHIIHKLLRSKYPKPSMPSPEGIPDVHVAAAVIGLKDSTILPVLNNLFSDKKVKLIQMEDAINFCLKAYMEEDKSFSVDESLMNVTRTTLNWLKNKDENRHMDKNEKVWKLGRKHKGMRFVENEMKAVESDTFLSSNQNQTTQTPPGFPVEERKLSPSAELGKFAFELLYLGGYIPNRYLVRMFVEYLKSLEDIKGWVLVNYPETIQQAALLEEALTGKPYKHKSESYAYVDDILDLDMRHLDIVPEKDPMAPYRKSVLFPDIDPPQTDLYYEPYLTTFVVMTKDNSNQMSDKYSHLHEMEKEQQRASLYKFYTTRGCYYHFGYEVLDFESIKVLGKLIITRGEDMSIRPSTEYFGASVSYLQACISQKHNPRNNPTFEKIGKKIEEPKQRFCFDDDDQNNKFDVSANIKAKKGKGKNKNVQIIKVVKVNKNTQIPDVSDISVEISTVPSEQTFTYLDIFIPERLQTVLATMWEVVEEVFCEDIKSTFFMYRVHGEDQIPYVTTMKRVSDVFLKCPDCKQDHIEAFQRYYNEIEDDLRSDEEIKGEIHCKIDELRNTLWGLCDDKKREHLEDRDYLIRNHWLCRNLVMYVDLGTATYQLQINLCKHTMQIITEYYVGMITKMPCVDLVLVDVILPTFDEMEAAFAYTLGCLEFTEICEANNVFLNYLRHNFELCESAIGKYKEACLTLLRSMEDVIKPKGGKKGSRSAKDSAGGKGGVKLPKFNGPDDEVLANADGILNEWNCLIESEHNRSLYKLYFIERYTIMQITKVLKLHIETSSVSYHNIINHHMNEMYSVNEACNVFRCATEAELKIQSRIVVEMEDFYIQPDVMLFLDNIPPLESPYKDEKNEFIFTVEQLSSITDILMELAPTGIILERSFAYLLQDILHHQDGTEWMAPIFWRHLTPVQLSLLVEKFFGKVEFIDWKDFIVFNLYLCFPSEEDILNARKEYRKFDSNATETVFIYQYNKVKLWFESGYNYKDESERKELKNIKKLLARLYTSREDTVNYTALLLAFCKDEVFLKGVVKAFELSLGKFICWDLIEGKAYAEDLIRRKMDVNLEIPNSTVEIFDGLEENNIEAEETLPFMEDDLHEEIDLSVMLNLIQHEEENEYLQTESESDTSRNIFSTLSSMDSQNESNDIAYFLPFQTVHVVMSACFPLYTQTGDVLSIKHQIELIYNQCRNKDLGNEVLISEFLNMKKFLSIFKENFKFVDKNPKKIVTSVIDA